MKIPGILSKIIAFTFLLFQTPIAVADNSKGEYVVLVHGIFRTSAHMRPLEKFLTNAGYEVINIDYPSTKYPVEKLIDLAENEINMRITDKTRTVNFVGYSMGALLVRGIIAKHRPEHLGRVVLLAPPNHGSEVADFWKNNYFYKKTYGPAGQQLTTQTIKNSTLFGSVDYELGIIAGNSTIDPFSSYIIPGDDDGKVSVASTRLEGMKDYVIVPASHTFFPKNKEVQNQVLLFLTEGKFKQ